MTMIGRIPNADRGAAKGGPGLTPEPPFAHCTGSPLRATGLRTQSPCDGQLALAVAED